MDFRGAEPFPHQTGSEMPGADEVRHADVRAEWFHSPASARRPIEALVCGTRPQGASASVGFLNPLSNRDRNMNDMNALARRRVWASYWPEEMAAALAAFDSVVLEKIDDEIEADEFFNGLNELHMRFGCRSAVFHAANVTGMRPREVYTILGGEDGAFERASECFRRLHGVPLIW